jgi:signal transduction histidine kinase
MAWLTDQILTLLASEAGSLTYHLVLAFSIAGAIQIAINQRTRSVNPLTRRILLGLSLLLLFQILLFAASGMVWQGILEGQTWLPFIDRALTLLSLVIIVWLWAFPQPDSMIDAASMVIGFLVIVGSIFLAIWWSRQGFTPVSSVLQTNGFPTQAAINGSPVDLLFQAASLIVAVIGLIILLIRRPAGWGIGLSMMVLLTAGHISYLLLLPENGAYPTAVRLFQMAAYPFLLMLPQRAVFQEEVETQTYQEESSPELDEQVEPLKLDAQSEAEMEIYAQILKPLLGLMEDLSAEQAYKRIVALLVATAKADYAFLVSPFDYDGQLQVYCGYDNLSKRYFDRTAIDASSFPILSSCFKMGRVRRLSSSSASPDRISLGQLFGLDQVGAMLFVPVLSQEGNPLAGIILVMADADSDWSIDQQSTIGLLAKFLILYRGRAQAAAELQSELTQAHQASRQIQGRIQQFNEEDQKLRDKITVLEERIHLDQEQIAVMSALVVDQELLRKETERLRAENEKLGLAIDRAKDIAVIRQEPLEGELRLALEEISLLRSTVPNAGDRIGEKEIAQEGGEPSQTQLEEIRSISQDLRQPLASIVGYIDVLLGESVGILGSNQRKYLERIKISTERFGRMLDELVQASLVESDASRIHYQEVDLRSLIETASHETNDLSQLRRVSLKTTLPEHPIYISTDRDALLEVITQLVRNAVSITQEGEDVEVTAQLERSDSEGDYILIQIADKGGGIPIQDLTRVFSPNPSGTVFEGVGDSGVDLVRLKTLVEVLGGRIWVDSEPGVGSIFSLLLPALPISTDEASPEGAN